MKQKLVPPRPPLHNLGKLSLLIDCFVHFLLFSNLLIFVHCVHVCNERHTASQSDQSDHGGELVGFNKQLRIDGLKCGGGTGPRPCCPSMRVSVAVGPWSWIFGIGAHCLQGVRSVLEWQGAPQKSSPVFPGAARSRLPWCCSWQIPAWRSFLQGAGRGWSCKRLSCYQVWRWIWVMIGTCSVGPHTDQTTLYYQLVQPVTNNLNTRLDASLFYNQQVARMLSNTYNCTQWTKTC